MVDALSPDVVFRSPVVYKPYEGRELVSVVLGAAVRVFEDFEYVRRIESATARSTDLTCSGSTTTA